MSKGKTFQIGDEVRWLVKNGSVVHRGKIVAIVPAMEDPRAAIERLITRHNAISMYGGGVWRDHESYVVLVNRGGRCYPRLYWPRVSSLRLAD